MRLKLLATIALTLIVSLLALVSASTDAGSAPAPALVPVHKASREKTVAIFVDSLSDRVATDPRVMPELARLARLGASFSVEPCRDRLTYLCLRAAFTGTDQSSPFALPRNFDHEHHETANTLLSELQGEHRRAVAVGSHDFLPYRAALFDAHYLSLSEESPERVYAAWQELARRTDADLTLVGLGSGDLAAHVHGTDSAEYRASFAVIDAIVAKIAAACAPGTNLVVFGDHGHDRSGRHLPGGPATTWAVAVGPAFRAGSAGQLTITDHRALFGLLLGVASPRTYTGPPLDGFVSASWLEREYPRGVPELRATNAVRGSRWRALGLALLVVLLGASAFALSVASVTRRPLPLIATAACALAGLSAALGACHDQIRLVVHDHGFTPQRALFLLVPLGAGFALAFVLRKARILRRARPGAWLPTGAALSLVVTFLLLLPNAYYYGAGRAVVYAALVMLVVALLDAWKHELPRGAARARVVVAVALALLTLASFSRVARAEGTEDSAVYVLDTALYHGSSWAPFLLAKASLVCLFGVASARTRPFDFAASTSLLTASLLVQLGHAELSRWLYAALFCALVLSHGWARRHAPFAHASGGLLLLNHFYPRAPVQLAPIELLLGATAAALFTWRSIAMQPDSRRAAQALTLLTSAYLMLWPTLGFRLSGLDYRFMFEWLPAQRYEELWWVIAIGALLKLGVPYLLLCSLARHAGVPARAGRLVTALLCAKVLALSLLIAVYAVGHSTQSHVGTDMLAELVLVSAVLLWTLPLARPLATLAAVRLDVHGPSVTAGLGQTAQLCGQAARVNEL